MVFLHEASTWENYSWSLLCLDFIYTRRVYFDLVLCFNSVYNFVHRVIYGWVTFKVIKFISILY